MQIQLMNFLVTVVVITIGTSSPQSRPNLKQVETNHVLVEAKKSIKNAVANKAMDIIAFFMNFSKNTINIMFGYINFILS